MPTESTCWSVDALLNLDGTLSCLTRKVCITRCGGSRLASARRSHPGSKERIQSCCECQAAAELCSAWTLRLRSGQARETPGPTQAFLAGHGFDRLHCFWRER